MATYDLQPLQDYFNDITDPKGTALDIYRLIANYARSVNEDDLAIMQGDIYILSHLAERIEAVEPMKNQTPKVLEGK